jgi:hypothetical protein
MITARDYNKGSWVAQANDSRRSAESAEKLCENSVLVNGASGKLLQTQPGEKYREAQ